jgi:hypothetical protein
MSGQTSLEREVSICAAIVGALAFASYALRAAPTAWLLDSSELVATTVRLSISHPPGHPAYTLAGALAALVPLGNAAFRVHLFCAACVAATVSLIPLTLHRLGAIRSRVTLGLAASAAIAAMLSTAFAFQAIRAEVYALEALSLAVATWAVAEPGDRLSPRAVVLAAIALATGLLNHHYITLFAFPAFATVVIARSGGLRAMGTNLALGCVFGVVGLLGYAYLIAASAGAPWPSWRWVDNGESLFWTVSAAAFQKTAARAAHVEPLAGLQTALGMLTAQVTPVGLLAAGAGLLAMVRAGRGLALFFALAIGGNLLTQVLFDFDPYNPDVGGYFMYSVFCTALLLGALGRLHTAEAPRTVRPVIALVAATTVLLALVQSDGGTRPSLAASRATSTLLDAQHSVMPPRTAWVTTYFETLFYSWYGDAVEDRRPDIVHLHRAWRTYPGYDAMFAARWPAEADALGVDGARGGISAAWLERRATVGTVVIEPESLVRADEIVDATPLWMGFVVGARQPSAEELDAVMVDLAASLDVEHDEQAARILLWTWFHEARLLLETGRPELAAVPARRAAALSPDDPELRALIEAIEVASRPAP